MNWLDDDLACRTVADRVAMYKKFLGSKFAAYNDQHDRVRRLVDRDGDGRADDATVFADGFNDPAAGIGAGVLARKGRCLVRLHSLALEAARSPTATAGPIERKLLHDGYGVHVGFLGHDLHGLRVRARRQALFQHRRPRLQRDHVRRQEAGRARYRVGLALQS